MIDQLKAAVTSLEKELADEVLAIDDLEGRLRAKRENRNRLAKELKRTESALHSLEGRTRKPKDTEAPPETVEDLDIDVEEEIDEAKIKEIEARNERELRAARN